MVKEIEIKLCKQFEDFSDMNMMFKNDSVYQKKRLDAFKDLEVDRKNLKMALIKLNEATENEEKRAKNEKKMAEKSKLVMLVAKPAMTRSQPPKVQVQRTEKTLDDSEL